MVSLLVRGHAYDVPPNLRSSELSAHLCVLSIPFYTRKEQNSTLIAVDTPAAQSSTT